MPATYGHPYPDAQMEFYNGVPPKRVIAWVIDLGFTAAIAFPFMLPFLVTGFLVFPLLAIPVIWTFVGFIYRWNTLANRSSTWGMRIMAIELREQDGQRLHNGTAFLHTLGTTLSFGIPIIQAISIFLMASSERGQGITDGLLGTAMLNKAA